MPIVCNSDLDLDGTRNRPLKHSIMLFSNQLLQVSVSLNYHTTYFFCVMSHFSSVMVLRFSKNNGFLAYFFCVMSHFSSVSVDIFTHITTAPLTSYLLPLIITARQRLITASKMPNNLSPQTQIAVTLWGNGIAIQSINRIICLR